MELRSIGGPTLNERTAYAVSEVGWGSLPRRLMIVIDSTLRCTDERLQRPELIPNIYSKRAYRERQYIDKPKNQYCRYIEQLSPDSRS
jgi:hypothetical protein